MYRRGTEIHPPEHTRVLVEFPRAERDYDPYKRLRQKVNAKVKQTKVSSEHFGKLIFIECMFDLRSVDREKVRQVAEAELKQSSNSVGIFLCKREANPHYRRHYSLIANFNSSAFAALPSLDPILERFQVRDTRFDPITNEPYQLTWSEASNRAVLHAKKIGSRR